MTVPQRLCFSAHLSKCHLGTCWHIELSMLAFSTFEMHGSITLSESNSWMECASPILISKFNLQAIVLRKVPQTGNQSMARTPAFFAGKDPRASPLVSMIKTQNAESKIVGWDLKLVRILLTQFFSEFKEFVTNTITMSSGPKPMQNCLKYEMFQTDFDVCVNFRCVRWCHHKTVYLRLIYCRRVKYNHIYI